LLLTWRRRKTTSGLQNLTCKSGTDTNQLAVADQKHVTKKKIFVYCPNQIKGHVITQNSDRDIHEPKLSEFRSRAITNGVGTAGCSIDRKTAAAFRTKEKTAKQQHPLPVTVTVNFTIARVSSIHYLDICI
jgi:hypothetical protein